MNAGGNDNARTQAKPSPLQCKPESGRCAMKPGSIDETHAREAPGNSYWAVLGFCATSGVWFGVLSFLSDRVFHAWTWEGAPRDMLFSTAGGYVIDAIFTIVSAFMGGVAGALCSILAFRWLRRKKLGRVAIWLLVVHVPIVIVLSPLLVRTLLSGKGWIIPILAGASSILVSVIISRKLPDLQVPGHCPTCGYNLTGNTSGVCPECGSPMRMKGLP